MESYSPQQKLDILKTVYHELHNSRLTVTAFENKIAFSFSTILLVFAAFILKGEYKLYGRTVLIAAAFIVAVTGVAVWFLIRNGDLIRVICRMILRIEEILGLHNENVFITKKEVDSLGGIPFPEPTVFPKEVREWGMNYRWQSVTPHVVGVAFSGLAAVLSLLLT